MRTMNFDAIAAAAPLDRQASTVRDGSGDLWAPPEEEGRLHWKAPPVPTAERPENAEDLTGLPFGRGMKVIAYFGSIKGNARWIVRCACGDYELRRAKAIKNATPDHCCHDCNYLQHMLVIARSRPNTKAARADDSTRLDQLAEKHR